MLTNLQASAQKPAYHFTSYSSKDGLASSEILALHLDKKKFLWIGHTAGISKFDGYQFTNFLFARDKKIGRVYDFAEDEDSTLWIASSKGLFIYNNEIPEAIKFTEGELTVYSLLVDDTHGLWLGTSKGPVYFNKQLLNSIKKQKQIAVNHYFIKQWFNINDDHRVKEIGIGKHGELYFGSFSSVYKFHNNTLQQIWKSIDRNDLLNRIAPMPWGEVFICSNSGGLIYQKDGLWKEFPTDPFNGTDFRKQNTGWYYYNTHSIYKIDPEHQKALLILDIPYEHQEWGTTFLEDGIGNFWIATHEGLLYAKPKIINAHVQENLEGFEELYSIYQLKDGTMLLGGNRGRLFKKNGGRFDIVYNRENRLFRNAEVKCIYEDEKGDIWFGSGYQGLARKTKKDIQLYNTTGGYGDKTFLSFYKCKNGDLWATGDNRALKIIYKEKDSVEFKHYVYQRKETENPTIRTAIESPSGKMYFGSGWGLALLNGNSLQEYQLQKGKHFSITDMKADGYGYIWVATQGNGILRCFFRNDSLIIDQELKAADGLSSDIFLNLLIDKENVVWAVAYNGINRLETSNKKTFISFLTIDEEDLKTGYQHGDLIQDKDGVIWLATSSGLFSFDPRLFAASFATPSIALEKVQLVGKPSSSSTDINYLFNRSTFSYKENSIEFYFTGIHYANPSAVQYQYRVSESDSTWIDAGTNRRIILHDLAPGRYTFQVRAAAGSNQWSRIAKYSFIIERPFWQAWWFVLLLALTISAIIFLAVRSRIAGIRKKAEVKNNFEKQIAQVKMNLLRAQMNPHFIFNSLNSINNFILKNDPKNASGYLTKFSRLMRMILDNSRSEWVTLESEISALDLYIRLEMLRFDHAFEFHLKISPEIITEQVVIPPLIIQPYVENAIWHGLLYRDKPGGLLQLNIFKEQNKLCIEVTDNGVGRKVSEELHSRSALKKKSHGMKITGERLDIVNTNYDVNAEVHIIDLLNAHEPGGTKVLIKLNYIETQTR